MDDVDIDSKLSLVSLIREHEASGQIVSIDGSSVPFQKVFGVEGDGAGPEHGGLGEAEEIEWADGSGEPEVNSAEGQSWHESIDCVTRSAGSRRGNTDACWIQENGWSSPTKRKTRRRKSASKAGRRRKVKRKGTRARESASSSLQQNCCSNTRQLTVSLTRCDEKEKEDKTPSHIGEKDKPYACSKCEKCFDEADKLEAHMRYNHGPFVCSKCGKTYLTGCSFYFHMRTKCKPDNSFECDLCGAVYRLERNLVRHKKQSHRDDNHLGCKKCSFKCLSEAALRNHMKKHERGRFAQCEYCGMHLRRDSLKAHILMHRGEKPHHCTKCEQAYRSVGQLKAHMKSRHSEIEKPFRCDQCCRGFLKADTLKYHLYSHTGEKPYKCTLCPSVFARKDYLNKHVRTHTGEKPYRCGQCEEKFAYPNSLKLHRQKRHGAASGAGVGEPTQPVTVREEEEGAPLGRAKEEPAGRAGEEELPGPPLGRACQERKGRGRQAVKRYIFLQPGTPLPFLPVAIPKLPETQVTYSHVT